MSPPIPGRLGLETARVPQIDRHGLVWLGRGKLYVEEGTLRFSTGGVGDLEPGDYGIPFQMISCIMLGPGGVVTHDALRLLARHGTGLVCVGEDGIRFYASMPFGPDESALARRQVEIWSDPARRENVVRRMYAIRLGEILPSKNLNALRGIEGSRMKETYKLMAQRYGINWDGRHYDRQNPESNNAPNQAINYASSGVEAAAMMATAAVGAIPQLGFIHENAGAAFCLDIADLYRDSITIPVAFSAARKFMNQMNEEPTLERIVRRSLGAMLRKQKTIPQMIDRIKELFDMG